jgi:hypothetical protein
MLNKHFGKYAPTPRGISDLVGKMKEKIGRKRKLRGNMQLKV